MARLTASTFNTTTTHKRQYTGLNPFLISPLYAAGCQGEHGPQHDRAWPQDCLAWSVGISALRPQAADKNQLGHHQFVKLVPSVPVSFLRSPGNGRRINSSLVLEDALATWKRTGCFYQWHTYSQELWGNLAHKYN